MNCALLPCAVFLTLISCAGPPRIYPAAESAGTGAEIACQTPFVEGQWQFLHSLEIRMPGGKKGVLMGAIVISSRTRSVRCVIMTIEGLVLFEAESGRQLTVHRGIAPFDRDEFARGVMDDIRFIFFRPRGSAIDVGILKNGARICRYLSAEGRLFDTVIDQNSSWQLMQYNRQKRLIRTVRALPGAKTAEGIPRQLVLTAREPTDYQLSMTLVEAVRIDP